MLPPVHLREAICRAASLRTPACQSCSHRSAKLPTMPWPPRWQHCTLSSPRTWACSAMAAQQGTVPARCATPRLPAGIAGAVYFGDMGRC